MSDLLTISDTDIQYRKNIPEHSKAVFLLIHGLGAHSARWDDLTAYFSRKKIAAYALELKGFGETKHLSGHIDSFKIYHQDINELLKLIKLDLPDHKIFLVGESMGGLLCFNQTLLTPHTFNGLICLAPAFKSIMSFKLLNLFKIYLAILTNPKKIFKVPLTSKMCTRDENFQLFMDNDPREIRIASAELLLQNILAQNHAKWHAAEIKIPTLFLLPGKDTVVSTQDSKKLYQKIVAKNKKMIEYPDMRHALSIDLDKEKVFADIWEWLTPQILT
jgi:acylglycerol lipase